MGNFGQKLLSARKIAGLSLQDLAEKMKINITKQALSQYENGQISPSSKVVIALSTALNLPVDYFFRQSDVKLENLEFRKRSALSRKEIDSVRFKTIDYLEKYLEIEDLLNIESSFFNPLSKNLVRNEQDIDSYAAELRKIWKLGTDPIPDVIALLEEHKLKVFEVNESEKFSGLSSQSGEVAVVVVNNIVNPERNTVNLVHKRFTALHELAHLLLDFPEDMKDKEKEHFCYSFAGAFLFPEEIFKQELGSKRKSILLNELILLENYYGMSVQAIMWRAKTLGLISESKFKEYKIWLSKSGNKKKEFGSFHGNETPDRFKRLVYKALSEDIITNSKAAALLNKPLSEMEEELTRLI